MKIIIHRKPEPGQAPTSLEFDCVGYNHGRNYLTLHDRMYKPVVVINMDIVAYFTIKRTG